MSNQESDPVNPVKKPPKTVEDWLAIGVNVVPRDNQIRTVNPETGIQSGNTSNVALVLDWGKKKKKKS